MSKFEAFALIIASDVRVALLTTLNPSHRTYAEMKGDIEETLGREVSDGSLSWHLVKLKGISVIAKVSNEWTITELGIELSNLIKSVELELG